MNMNISVNGKDQVLDKVDVTVSDLLKINDVEMPDMVSVQLNGEFVKREEFPDTMLKESDEIDFMYFMGGGSSK
jgi:sulfur carrier protein